MIPNVFIAVLPVPVHSFDSLTLLLDLSICSNLDFQCNKSDDFRVSNQVSHSLQSITEHKGGIGKNSTTLHSIHKETKKVVISKTTKENHKNKRVIRSLHHQIHRSIFFNASTPSSPYRFFFFFVFAAAGLLSPPELEPTAELRNVF